MKTHSSLLRLPAEQMAPDQVICLILDLIKNLGKHTRQILAHPAGLQAIKLRFRIMAALRDWFGSQVNKKPHELDDKWNIAFSVFTEITGEILHSQHIRFNPPTKYSITNHVSVLRQWCGICTRVASGNFGRSYRKSCGVCKSHKSTRR